MTDDAGGPDEPELQLEQYRAITEVANDVIITIDETSTIRSVNPAVEDVFGYTPNELIGDSLTKLMPEEYVPQHRAGLAEYLQMGERTIDWDHVELPGVRADGDTIPLGVSFGEIEYESERFFTGIIRDISQHKHYQRQLEESNERLEQFAYAASHDLQEPLRMVTSYLELIEKRYGEDLDEEGEEFLEFALDGAERMDDMIAGLLKYSRIETQDASFEPVDLEAVLADVQADLQLKIKEHDADVSAESLPTVEGDADQLRQVFQNLLSNAIEYSGDEPPRVHISAESTGDERLISVRDEGIGINAEDTDRIFQVFQRLHGAAETAGTGIGLAVCQRIIEHHDGDIWADSEPGRGTTISFTLPALGQYER